MKGYEKLIVWQKADELAFLIYQVSKRFPKDELYGLTSQLRRAALSVPTNIAEGAGRQGRNETKHFSNIALGSLSEVEYLLHFCERSGFLSADEKASLAKVSDEVGALLWGFYKSF